MLNQKGVDPVQELTIAMAALATTLLGIVGWVVRNGMTRMASALEKSVKTMGDMMHQNELAHIKMESRLDRMDTEHDDHEQEVRDIAKRLEDLCPLDAVTIDKLKRISER